MIPRRRYELALYTATLLGGTLLGACHVTRPNHDHCFYAEGDQTCAALDPARPYCAGPGCGQIVPGCVADLPLDECYSPCGHAALVDEDAACIDPTDASASTDTSGESGSGSGPDMATDECQEHTDCPELEPYCSFGTCTTCDALTDPAAACFALTGGASTLCVEGVCVECTQDDASACADAAQICDLETNTCAPCTAHDQCPGGAACDLVHGACLPADAVWHVDGDGGQDFLTIAEALAALGNGSGTLIVHELDTNGYVEGVSFAGDRALALFGAPGERPLLYMSPVSLEVLDGARVYARDLILRGQDALLVTAGYVELDAMILAPQLRHTLRAEDAVLRIRNSMLRSTFAPDYPTLTIAGASDLDLRYSTLLAMGDHAAIACQGAALAPGSRVRNSVLVNLGTPHAVQCASPSYEHNGLEDATGFVDNVTIGDCVFQWFADPAYGDLHLSNIAPVSIASAAVWSEGDPLLDFDGEPRPTVEGSSDFAGADRL